MIQENTPSPRPSFEPERFQPVTRGNVAKQPEWDLLDADIREGVEVVSLVLPFRTNRYV
ncbi:MAG: hypothetical protein RLZZ461_1244, partial [Planctomycetota bacterium]